MGFVDNHCLGDVLQDLHVSKELMKKQPNEIDLRFFSRVDFGDTFDGAPNPMRGIQCTCIFYGSQPVYLFKQRYIDGEGVGFVEQGVKLYKMMCDVSCAYLQILSIARSEYCSQEFSTGLNSAAQIKEDLLDLRENQISIDRATWFVLREHPQYKEFVDDYGVALIPLTDSEFEYSFRVEVSNRYSQTYRRLSH